MAPPRFTELTKRQRRRLILLAFARVSATTLLLLVLYYALPVDNRSETTALVMLSVGMVVFLSALAWQVRQIINADYPQLRAIEGAGVAVPLLIVVFAFVYLNLAASDPATFSEPLTRSATLYFTITVLSTVGFGDITPVGDTPRMIVSLQMLLDLVLIGFILRLLTGAARTGLQRQVQPDAPLALGGAAGPGSDPGLVRGSSTPATTAGHPDAAVRRDDGPDAASDPSGTTP